MQVKRLGGFVDRVELGSRTSVPEGACGKKDLELSTLAHLANWLAKRAKALS